VGAAMQERTPQRAPALLEDSSRGDLAWWLLLLPRPSRRTRLPFLVDTLLLLPVLEATLPHSPVTCLLAARCRAGMPGQQSPVSRQQQQWPQVQLAAPPVTRGTSRLARCSTAGSAATTRAGQTTDR